MKITRNRFLWLASMAWANTACADNVALCDKPGDWEPVLNFDIEKNGFIKSLIFISGHSYSLTATNAELSKAGKQSFFCCNGPVGSSVLVDILNEKLSGVVTAETVTETIITGLKEKFPCK